MDTIELLDHAMELLDETALLLAGLPPELSHPPIGSLLVAHGIVRTVRQAQG